MSQTSLKNRNSAILEEKYFVHSAISSSFLAFFFLVIFCPLWPQLSKADGAVLEHVVY